MTDNPDGVVLDNQVEVGNPAYAPLLMPALERISVRAGRVPAAVTADRQYGEVAVDQQLAALGWSGWRSLARASWALPAKPPGTPAGSGDWSSGAPAARGGSATSNPSGRLLGCAALAAAPSSPCT